MGWEKLLFASLAALGIGAGIYGVKNASEANENNKRAKEILDEANTKLRESAGNVNSVLNDFGWSKNSFINTIDNLSTVLARIKDKPEFSSIQSSNFPLPQVTLNDIKEASDKTKTFIAGAAGATAGGLIGLGLCGVGLMALTSSILTGGLFIGVAGTQLKKKSISNLNQAIEYQQESENVVGLYKDLANCVACLDKAFRNVFQCYTLHLNRLNQIVTNSNLNYAFFTDYQKRELKAVVLLAKLLFAMSRAQLICYSQAGQEEANFGTVNYWIINSNKMVSEFNY